MKSSRSDMAGKSATARTLWLCVALVLGACTGMGADYDPPTVTVNYVKPASSDSSALRFEIGLRVVNPNEVPLRLTGAAYTVKLDGYELLSGASNNLPAIEAYSEGDLTIEAQAGFLESINFLRSLSTEPRDRFVYELNVKLGVKNFPVPIRVEDTGTIVFQP